jgi:hypothetical protein
MLRGGHRPASQPACLREDQQLLGHTTPDYAGATGSSYRLAGYEAKGQLDHGHLRQPSGLGRWGARVIDGMTASEVIPAIPWPHKLLRKRATLSHHHCQRR